MLSEHAELLGKMVGENQGQSPKFRNKGHKEVIFKDLHCRYVQDVEKQYWKKREQKGLALIVCTLNLRHCARQSRQHTPELSHRG